MQNYRIKLSKLLKCQKNIARNPIRGSRKVCQIFDFAKSFWWKVVECNFSLSRIHQTHCLLIYFWTGCEHGLLNEEPTVVSDEARPANNCIPLSFLGNVPIQLCRVPTPKNTFASIKKLEEFGKITFHNQKIRERFLTNSLWQQWVGQMQNLAKSKIRPNIRASCFCSKALSCCDTQSKF